MDNLLKNKQTTNMNRRLFFLPLASLLLLLGSCSTEVDPLENAFAVPYSTTAFVAYPDGSASICDTRYVLTNYPMAGTCVLNSTGVVVGDQTCSFTTDQMPYTSSLLAGGLTEQKFSGGSAMWNETPITGITCLIPSQKANVSDRTEVTVPGYPSSAETAFFLSYAVGDLANVRTFMSDACYVGSTQTIYSYNGDNKTYSNADVIYRVCFKQAHKKADLLIYHAKFAEEQPEIQAMLLKDLDVTINANGYTIRNNSGDIVPEVYEAGELIPNARYPFNSIVISSSNEQLSEVSIIFTVAGSFQGTFRGTSYL